MRVLLCLHGCMDPDAGAPGTTMALGGALEALGCDVEYLTFDDVYPRAMPSALLCQLGFPWGVAGVLARRTGRYDIVDASTGDAWVWASLKRPGARRDHALLTRTHGLEHVAAIGTRAAAREMGPPLRWRYRVYHGGYRLWEVRRSMQLSDHCVLLNRGDRDYAVQRLGIARERVSLITNGIPDRFHEPGRAISTGEGPLRIAFIGRWTTHKGKTSVQAVTSGLQDAGVDYELTVLGSGDTDVAGDLPGVVGRRLTVISRFDNRDLPGLLAGHEIFLFPSRFEGASGSLLEAMACGLAPVATAVGSAPELIRPDENGVLVDVGDAGAMVRAMVRLAGDRELLTRMRREAQGTARGLGWSAVAARTLALYERVLEARSR